MSSTSTSSPLGVVSSPLNKTGKPRLVQLKQCQAENTFAESVCVWEMHNPHRNDVNRTRSERKISTSTAPHNSHPQKIYRPRLHIRLGVD